MPYHQDVFKFDILI